MATTRSRILGWRRVEREANGEFFDSSVRELIAASTLWRPSSNLSSSSLALTAIFAKAGASGSFSKALASFQLFSSFPSRRSVADLAPSALKKTSSVAPLRILSP
jgi:hypothetical protein